MQPRPTSIAQWLERSAGPWFKSGCALHCDFEATTQILTPVENTAGSSPPHCDFEATTQILTPVGTFLSEEMRFCQVQPKSFVEESDCCLECIFFAFWRLFWLDFHQERPGASCKFGTTLGSKLALVSSWWTGAASMSSL